MTPKIFRHNHADLGYTDLVCDTPKVGGRTYLTPEGKKYPSITSVLSILKKDAINEWRARVGEQEANRVSRQAADRGTAVHTLVEQYLQNKPIALDKLMPHIRANFLSLKSLLDANLDDIVLQEKPLYSDHLGVAGRCDIIAKWKGKLAVIDIKTSARAKTAEDIHSYFLQESAYAVMMEERTSIPVPRLVTLMSVDNAPASVFQQRRDDWTDELLRTIAEFKKRALFGH